MRLAPHRGHFGWWAFAVHRATGLALAVFLPLHFLVMGEIDDAERFDALARYVRHPLLVVVDAGLLAALVVHLAGGLRLLALEFLPWHAAQGRRIVAVFALGALTFVVLLALEVWR